MSSLAFHLMGFRQPCVCLGPYPQGPCWHPIKLRNKKALSSVLAIKREEELENILFFNECEYQTLAYSYNIGHNLQSNCILSCKKKKKKGKKRIKSERDGDVRSPVLAHDPEPVLHGKTNKSAELIRLSFPSTIPRCFSGNKSFSSKKWMRVHRGSDWRRGTTYIECLSRAKC